MKSSFLPHLKITCCKSAVFLVLMTNLSQLYLCLSCIFHVRSVMLARKGLLPDGFLLTRLAEDQNQPNRSRSRSQRARFITKTGSCNVAHKNIREQVEQRVFGYDVVQHAMKASDMQDFSVCCSVAECR